MPAAVAVSDPAPLPTVPIIRPWLDEQEARAAYEAVLSGWIAQGPQVRAFETAFCQRLQCHDAVAVSSATTGLHLALLAAGVQAGDEVVCPSLSFIATANSVRYCAAVPVFADVDPVTQNLTPATVAAVLTPKTRAVLLVHQVGMPADVESIQAVVPSGVAIVEDAACAIGSTYRDRPIGSHSPFVVFSFHPRKLVTTGEGGMITLQDSAVGERIRRLRQHAMSLSDVARHASNRFQLESYDELGFNYRMTDIQAAIGLVQLGKLRAIVQRRRELADRYFAQLSGRSELVLPRDPPHGTTNYQSYTVLLRDDWPGDRNGLIQALFDRGISARRGIMAAHLEPAYAGHAHGSLPQTERWAARSLTLPLYHQMTETDQDRVVAALTAAL